MRKRAVVRVVVIATIEYDPDADNDNPVLAELEQQDFNNMSIDDYEVLEEEDADEDAGR